MTVRVLMRLSDAVELEGYRLVEGDLAVLTRERTTGSAAQAGEPATSASLVALGAPAGPVAVCEGSLVVCPEDCWDYAYSAAHEIAEHRYGFDHSAEMFAEQSNILARWLKHATHRAERVKG